MPHLKQSLYLPHSTRFGRLSDLLPTNFSVHPQGYFSITARIPSNKA